MNKFEIYSLSSREIADVFPDKVKKIFNLKKAFGDKYVIELEGAYKLEKAELRDPIECYYVVPARYGHFYSYGGDTIVLYCTANRIKEQILRQFKKAVTLFLECEDESILLFDKDAFLEIAPIAKAKRRRGRKALSEIEKKRLEEAGKGYQFMGKSPQHTELEQAISPPHDKSVTA
jgi:uncharacterized membrane protein